MGLGETPHAEKVVKESVERQTCVVDLFSLTAHSESYGWGDSWTNTESLAGEGLPFTSATPNLECHRIAKTTDKPAHSGRDQ